MAGDWRAGEGTDLADLLMPFAGRLTDLVPPPLSGCARSWTTADPARTSENTPGRGRARNISAHYDLSNDLFAAFLDETH